MGHALWGPWQFTVTGSLRDWDVRSRLGEIDVPVLVTSGRDDYALAHDVIEMAEMLPGGEYVCVGAGHEGFLQGRSLNLFLKLVDGFMQDRDAHASDRGVEVR
jgi:pimeloyl-ACP methyl ester carboxylesterase